MNKQDVHLSLDSPNPQTFCSTVGPTERLSHLTWFMVFNWITPEKYYVTCASACIHLLRHQIPNVLGIHDLMYVYTWCKYAIRLIGDL